MGFHGWVTTAFVPPTPWQYNWVLTRGNATVTVTNPNNAPMTVTLGSGFGVFGLSWVSPTGLVIPAGGTTNLTANCSVPIGTGNLDPLSAFSVGTWSCGEESGTYTSEADYTIRTQ